MEPETESELTVLIVDDNQSMREFLTTLLTHEGYRCESATNGRGAMGKVTRGHFDVVMTDLHMPKMGGITLTRGLGRQFEGLPVMIMTGALDERSQESALSAGAREVLGKPFAISDFMMRLQKTIHLQEPVREPRV